MITRVMCQHLRTITSFSLTKTFCSYLMSHLLISNFKWVGQKCYCFSHSPRKKKRQTSEQSEDCLVKIAISILSPLGLTESSWDNYSYHPFYFTKNSRGVRGEMSHFRSRTQSKQVAKLRLKLQSSNSEARLPSPKSYFHRKSFWWS